MNTAKTCLTSLVLFLVNTQAGAQEVMNSAVLWFCEDSRLAHGACSTVWTALPSGGFFGGRTLDFECELRRSSVTRDEDTRVLEDITSSGTQVSSLLETELSGFNANYCTRNLSEITIGVTNYSNSIQYCRPYSSSKIVP